MGNVPIINIDRAGAVAPREAGARDVLRAATGVYALHRTDGMMLWILDPSAGKTPRASEPVALAGDIQHMPLLGLANLLGQNSETGRLVVRRGEVERVILLKSGHVAHVSSNLARDRLGSFLVRLGRVAEDALEQADATARKDGIRIGQVLVQQKLLEPHELWSCIQEQMTELFAEVVQWTEGSFVLYRLAENHPFPSTPPLSMQGLLLESVRRADEMSVFRERIPSMSARLRRTQKAPRENLGDEEKVALKELGAEASVAEMARKLKINEFEATRLCYQLLKTGLIEIPKTPTVPPQKAFHLPDEDKQRIYLYNLAFREIKDEIDRHGHAAMFLDSVRKFLGDKKGAFHDLFRGVPVDASGTLNEMTLVLNLSAQHGLGADTSALLREALNELTFFMLFQTGEMLDSKSDENLGRRVRLIHAALPTAAR